jgi:hypothetical protein
VLAQHAPDGHARDHATRDLRSVVPTDILLREGEASQRLDDRLPLILVEREEQPVVARAIGVVHDSALIFAS